MKWGIVFKMPSIYESELWDMPKPSYRKQFNRSDGSYSFKVYYHFEYPPQSWQEWQQVAAIKIQIQKRIRRAEFLEYVFSEVEGPIYTVSELGRSFAALIKFPKAQYPVGKQEVYKMLCRYAKRLHYYSMLHVELLIAISFRFNMFEQEAEGISQTVKRAKSAYLMALKNKENWEVRLSPEERYRIQWENSMKTAQIKRSHPRCKEAIRLRFEGKNINEIAKLLGVSRSTVGRWLKEAVSH